MELFQSFQWIYGDLINNYEIFGPHTCSRINKNYTYVAYILIWLQPLLFSVIGYTELKKKIFIKLIIFNILLFCYALYSIILGTEFNKQKYNIPNSNFGINTCTDIGISHHLSWRFSVLKIDMALNNLTYLILCIFSFLFYKKELTNIWKGWIMALVITKIILNPYDTEIPSSWCLLSIFANFIIMLGADYGVH